MDKAILYNVTLEKVNKRIEELKSIGFKMEEFEKAKEEIIKKNKADVQKSYNYANPSLSLGQAAFLEQDYSKSISELNKLYNKLLDYEIYAMAYYTAKLVKEFLELDNKREEDFAKYREKIELVLRNLHKSQTLDYDVEGPVIEEIYNVVYLFIKEEMKQFCDSLLLNRLGEIDKYYIDKLVRKDIEQIDLKDEKNKIVSLKANEIASKGFEASYANRELILSIVGGNDTFDAKRTTLNELNKKLDDFLQSIDKLYNSLNNQAQSFDKKTNMLSLAKNGLKLFLNSVVAFSLVTGAYKLFKADKTATYMTTTTTYNPLQPEPYKITEEYMPIEDDSLRVIDYGPVTGDGKRIVAEYDLSDYQNLSIEELFNMDFASLVKPEDISVLENKDINLEYLTNEAFRIINKIDVNLEDVKVDTEINTIEQIALICVSEILALILYACYALKVYKNSIIDEAYLPIIGDIKGIYNDLKVLIKNDEDNKEYQKKLSIIIRRLDTLTKENRDLFDTVDSYISTLEANEEYKYEINELKRKLNLIENKKQGIINKL